ncbi:MAG TPA: RcnB family protein [Caulobacteraceae bacterium]|nr:RcnB family protein [Caulobacteraceae bacterium]
MKTIVLAVAAAAMLVAGAASAQPGYRIAHTYGRGEHIDRDQWSQSQPVDWRAHHLRAPPRGYEWREVNGQYVLAAVATGLILSAILSAASH